VSSSNWLLSEDRITGLLAIGSAGFVSEGSLARGSGPIAVELIAWFPE
jgi:hypothetical protein